MEQRLIDANAMQEKAFQMNFHGRITEHQLFLFNRAISEMPTVDAVPVVHAYWKKHKKGGIYCSACKHDNHYGNVSLIMSYVVKFPFCPYCGATMDGERKDGAE